MLEKTVGTIIKQKTKIVDFWSTKWSAAAMRMTIIEKRNVNVNKNHILIWKYSV